MQAKVVVTAAAAELTATHTLLYVTFQGGLFLCFFSDLTTKCSAGKCSFVLSKCSLSFTITHQSSPDQSC